MNTFFDKQTTGSNTIFAFIEEHAAATLGSQYIGSDFHKSGRQDKLALTINAHKWNCGNFVSTTDKEKLYCHNCVTTSDKLYER